MISHSQQTTGQVRRNSRSLRILVAEDTPAIQLLLGRLLTLLGHQLAAVNTGLEAVEVFEQGSFDLILMDVQMPEMDGIEAARKIRAIEHERGGRRAPIIALTACAAPMDCYRAGMDRFLGKPIELSVLERLIEGYCVELNANLDAEEN